MRFGDTKIVAIADIPKPLGWSERMGTANVRRLVESMRETGGMIHLPVLHGTTLEIVSGGDRIAALETLGISAVEARMFAGDDHEIALVRAAENAVRRQDGAVWLARLVQLRREKACASDAVAEVAQIAGVSTRTVERAVQASAALDVSSRPEPPAIQAPETEPSPQPETPRRRRSHLRGVESPAETSAAVVETWGIPSASSYMPYASIVQAAVDTALSHIRAAGVAMKSILDDRLLPAQSAQHVREVIKSASYAVRSVRPAALCPYCRVDPDKIRTCGFCDGLGAIGQAALDATPEALRVQEDLEF